MKTQYSEKALAFFKAMEEDRFTLREVNNYYYAGNSFGKDIFINKITGGYLD